MRRTQIGLAVLRRQPSYDFADDSNGMVESCMAGTYIASSLRQYSGPIAELPSDLDEVGALGTSKCIGQQLAIVPVIQPEPAEDLCEEKRSRELGNQDSLFPGLRNDIAYPAYGIQRRLLRAEQPPQFDLDPQEIL